MSVITVWSHWFTKDSDVKQQKTTNKIGALVVPFLRYIAVKLETAKVSNGSQSNDNQASTLHRLRSSVRRPHDTMYSARDE